MKGTLQIQESWLADTGQLQIRFDYDPEIISMLNGIKGAHWLPAGRCWIVPELRDIQKAEKALSIDFQTYKPYLTKKGIDGLKPFLKKLDHY